MKTCCLLAELGATQYAITDLRRAVATLIAKSDETSIASAEKSLAAAREEFEKGYMVVVVNMATTKEEQAMVAEIKAIVPDYIAVLAKAVAASKAGKADEAKEHWLNSSETGTKLDAAFSEEIEFNKKFAADALQASNDEFSSTFFVVSGLIAGIMVLSLAIGWYMARWFTNAILEVASIADDVASASQQLAGAAGELSSGAQEQASSLEETASSLEEITSTIQQNADNAQQANQLAGKLAPRG